MTVETTPLLTEAQRALLARLHFVDQCAQSFSGEPTAKWGHVYFFQQGECGPIKIGCSLDVARRFREIQTGCAVPLRVLGVVPMAGFAMERRLHDLLSADRLSGEWFRPSELLYGIIGDFAGAIR